MRTGSRRGFPAILVGRRADSNPTGLDCHDRAGGKLFAVAIEDVDACRALLARRHAHQANETRMRSAKGHRKLTEIFVKRHQHTGLFMRESEDFLVPWILVPIASPLRIVAGAGKVLFGLPPDAGVEQDPHEPVWRSRGSMRS